MIPHKGLLYLGMGKQCGLGLGLLVVGLTLPGRRDDWERVWGQWAEEGMEVRIGCHGRTEAYSSEVGLILKVSLVIPHLA